MRPKFLLLSATATVLCVLALVIALMAGSFNNGRAMANDAPAFSPQTSSHTASPVLVGGVYYGTKYSPTNNYIYALNAKTGAVLWQYPTSVSVYTLTVSQGNVYFGQVVNYTMEITAINARTAQLVWQTSSTYLGNVASLFVTNGVLYAEITTETSTFLALNAGSGTLLWTYFDHSGSYEVSFVLNQGVFYMASSQSSGRSGTSLCAVQANSGVELWCINYQGGGGVSTPFVSGKTVTIEYIPYSANPALDTYQIADGSPVWQRQNTILLGGYQGTIYASVNGSNVVEALNAHTGALLWRNRVGAALVKVQIENNISNGILYVNSSHGRIDAISTGNRSLLWRYNTGEIFFPLNFGNGVVYIYADSSIYALNASSGSPIWVSSLTARIDAISADLGIVYALDSQHSIVYALSLQTGQQLWSY